MTGGKRRLGLRTEIAGRIAALKKQINRHKTELAKAARHKTVAKIGQRSAARWTLAQHQ